MWKTDEVVAVVGILHPLSNRLEVFLYWKGGKRNRYLFFIPHSSSQDLVGEQAVSKIADIGDDLKWSMLTYLDQHNDIFQK